MQGFGSILCSAIDNDRGGCKCYTVNTGLRAVLF
jgi:hypothetical protein